MEGEWESQGMVTHCNDIQGWSTIIKERKWHPGRKSFSALKRNVCLLKPACTTFSTAGSAMLMERKLQPQPFCTSSPKIITAIYNLFSALAGWWQWCMKHEWGSSICITQVDPAQILRRSLPPPPRNKRKGWLLTGNWASLSCKTWRQYIIKRSSLFLE